MIAFDTNHLVRHIVQDDPDQCRTVARLIDEEAAENRAVRILDLVLLETSWVLESIYGFDRAAWAEVLGELLDDSAFSFDDPAMPAAVQFGQSRLPRLPDPRQGGVGGTTIENFRQNPAQRSARVALCLHNRLKCHPTRSAMSKLFDGRDRDHLEGLGAIASCNPFSAERKRVEARIAEKASREVVVDGKVSRLPDWIRDEAVAVLFPARKKRSLRRVYGERDEECYARLFFVWSYHTLITGPSGTGKELVARAVGLSGFIPFHRETGFEGAGKQAFYPVNLSALSTTLIESELFGHRRGAFTGAVEAEAFTESACAQLDQALPEHHPWSGNFRELERILSHYLIHGELRIGGPGPGGGWRGELEKFPLLPLREVSVAYAEAVWRRTGGYAQCARVLQVDQRTVRKMVHSP